MKRKYNLVEIFLIPFQLGLLFSWRFYHSLTLLLFFISSFRKVISKSTGFKLALSELNGMYVDLLPIAHNFWLIKLALLFLWLTFCSIMSGFCISLSHFFNQNIFLQSFIITFWKEFNRNYLGLLFRPGLFALTNSMFNNLDSFNSVTKRLLIKCRT